MFAYDLETSILRAIWEDEKKEGGKKKRQYLMGGGAAHRGMLRQRERVRGAWT